MKDENPQEEKPEQTQPEVPVPQSSSEANPALGLTTAMIGLLVWGAIGSAVIWSFPKGREFMISNKLAIGIGLLVLIVLSIVPATRRWFKQATATVRAGLGIFLLVPLIFITLVTLFFWPAEVQVAIVRSVLIVLLCLLPGSMYFLFIATKKYSLVDEFLNNVKRLGLVDVDWNESKWGSGSERRDIEFYINKFEAVLGRLPADFVQTLLAKRSSEASSEAAFQSQQSTGLAELFTRETLLPVVLTTFLVALCWIVALPPWHGTLKLKPDAPVEQPAEEPQPQTTDGHSDGIERPVRDAGVTGYRYLPLSMGESPILTVVRQEAGVPQAGAAAEPAPGDSNVDTKAADSWKERWLEAITPMPRPEFYAFMGAYFFSLQLLFRRYVRRDLRPSAYVSVSIRIAIAVIGTWAAVQAAKIVGVGDNKEIPGAGLLVLGFIIGVFPRVAWQFIAVAGQKLFGDVLGIPSFQTKLPISDIDGLTSWHEARLEEEDIENVPNMATADIVDLILNTRIPTDRIVDWMDQAILYTHIGAEDQTPANTRRKLLRLHGIYTASALVRGYDESNQNGLREDFEKILGDTKPSPVVCLVGAVKTNPNLEPIMRWRRLR